MGVRVSDATIKENASNMCLSLLLQESRLWGISLIYGHRKHISAETVLDKKNTNALKGNRRIGRVVARKKCRSVKVSDVAQREIRPKFFWKIKQKYNSIY